MSLRSIFRSRDRFGGKAKIDFQVGGVHQAEQALRDAFAIIHKRLGYKIWQSQTDFPDYTLKDMHGKEIKAEAKENASSFKGYDPQSCDLLICWKDDWPDCPVPKLVVSKYAQERPWFEGFAGGEPPGILSLLDSPIMLSSFLKAFHNLAVDVRDLVFLNAQVQYLSGGGEDIANIAEESPPVGRIKHGDHYFGLMFSFSYERWNPKASNVMLSVDLDNRVFEVRANIAEGLIGKFSCGKWEDLFKEVMEEGYAVSGQLNAEGGSSEQPDIGSAELLEEIAKGRVRNLALTKRCRFTEVFSGDPYDVVSRLHSEFQWALEFLQEQLYVHA